MKPTKKYRPMKLLTACPKAPVGGSGREPVWGNPKNKDLGYRCTKCGQEHG